MVPDGHSGGVIRIVLMSHQLVVLRSTPGMVRRLAKVCRANARFWWSLVETGAGANGARHMLGVGELKTFDVRFFYPFGYTLEHVLALSVVICDISG